MGNTPVLHPPLDEYSRRFGDWSMPFMQQEAASNPITTPLYQYTTAAGLEGMIRTKAVWFTGYRHLNDPAEINFALSLAIALLRERIVSERSEHVRLFLNSCAVLLEKDSIENIFGFYLGCFSRKSNDLGQWRAYADDGRGYALGFSSEVFAIREKETVPHMVASVQYGTDLARARLNEAIGRAVSLVVEAEAAHGELLSDEDTVAAFHFALFRELSVLLIFISVTSKHECYQHEEEVRLLHIGPHASRHPSMSVRIRGHHLVPYVPVPLEVKDPFIEVIIGPALDEAAARDGLQHLLRLHGCGELPIRASTIPYRSLSSR